jgi:transcriptional regulator with XRE-family HTH domain
MKFCEKLKLLREERNMNITEFATLLGTSKQVISRYERGENTPKITTVSHYANILNVSLEYLMNDDVNDKKGNNNGAKKSPDEIILTEGEKLMLALFRQIPADQQERFLAMGRLYADSLKKD